MSTCLQLQLPRQFRVSRLTDQATPSRISIYWKRCLLNRVTRKTRRKRSWNSESRNKLLGEPELRTPRPLRYPRTKSSLQSPWWRSRRIANWNFSPRCNLLWSTSRELRGRKTSKWWFRLLKRRRKKKTRWIQMKIQRISPTKEDK